MPTHTHKRTRKNRKKKRKKFKKIQCSPKTKKQTLDFTCYTSDALHKLKKVWNARHPDEKIHSNVPREIWTTLKHKMDSTCNTEACWLRQQCIKHDIDQSLWETTFAPVAPEEWTKKPDEWLSTIDIQKVMKQWEKSYKCFEFLGPSPIDYDKQQLFGECVWEELCKFSLESCKKRNKYKIGVIFNLDIHSKPGSHWVAMYIDLRKHIIYYFDSYGDPIPRRIRKFATKVKKQGKSFGEKYTVIVSKKRHQYGESECGMYCLYFIIQMLLDKQFSSFQKKKIPDKKMLALRKKYFNSPKHT